MDNQQALRIAIKTMREKVKQLSRADLPHEAPVEAARRERSRREQKRELCKAIEILERL